MGEETAEPTEEETAEETPEEPAEGGTASDEATVEVKEDEDDGA